ncbi:uncharacterized protein LOC106668368 isoform X2 [Cimex lectularius]|uniref:F-box domain-containing protein n=1 Tax=Cimex lectularius TaxID=79782 RepID=A0A8I6RUF8_CIMLE|nr:uncharacterized protein LOC106668368 isoform X2 [Cimex lectularius]
MKIGSVPSCWPIYLANVAPTLHTTLDTYNDSVVAMDEKTEVESLPELPSDVCQEKEFNLPIEMISYILDFVDGKTLAKCRQVCKDWRTLIDSTLPSGWNRWFEVCINEIPEEQIYDFIGHHMPKYWMDSAKRLDYLYIFQRWTQWQHFLKRTKYVKHLATMSADIVSIKTSGEWLFIGMRNGQLNAYSFAKEKVFTLMVLGPIQSMYLRCTTEPDFISFSALENVGHDELVLDMSVRMAVRFNLHTNVVTLLNKLRPQYVQYIAFEDHEVTADFTNFTSKFTSTFMDGTASKEYPAIYHLLTVWNGYIMMKDDADKVLVVDKYFNEVKHPFSKMHLPGGELLMRIFIGIDAIISFTYALNSHHPLEVNVLGEEKNYSCDIFPNVCCGFYYANHLFLGTDISLIAVFYIKQLKDLFHLDKMEPHRKQTIYLPEIRDPIVSIDISEAKEKMSIIVASLYDIFEISFSPCQNV